jgi:hypothetical protein
MKHEEKAYNKKIHRMLTENMFACMLAKSRRDAQESMDVISGGEKCRSEAMNSLVTSGSRNHDPNTRPKGSLTPVE